jgi:hypothetical protein
LPSWSKGPGWLEWYTGKFTRYGLTPHDGDLTSAATYLEHERAVTLSAARRSGWSVIMIGQATERSPAEILRDAKVALRPIFPAITPGTG